MADGRLQEVGDRAEPVAAAGTQRTVYRRPNRRVQTAGAALSSAAT